MIDENKTLESPHRCEHEHEHETSAWVLTTKRVGDTVAGWVITSLEETNIRRLETSERCDVTSFCYPTGARMVRARVSKAAFD